MFTGELMRVIGLTPGSTYAFSLSAGNAVGYGPAVKFRVATVPREQAPPTHRHSDTAGALKFHRQLVLVVFNDLPTNILHFLISTLYIGVPRRHHHRHICFKKG